VPEEVRHLVADSFRSFAYRTSNDSVAELRNPTNTSVVDEDLRLAAFISPRLHVSRGNSSSWYCGLFRFPEAGSYVVNVLLEAIVKQTVRAFRRHTYNETPVRFYTPPENGRRPSANGPIKNGCALVRLRGGGDAGRWRPPLCGDAARVFSMSEQHQTGPGTDGFWLKRRRPNASPTPCWLQTDDRGRPWAQNRSQCPADVRWQWEWRPYSCRLLQLTPARVNQVLEGTSVYMMGGNCARCALHITRVPVRAQTRWRDTPRPSCCAWAVRTSGPVKRGPDGSPPRSGSLRTASWA
jgi:hypothetical protein